MATPTVSNLSDLARPLTVLNEEEQMFRDTVRRFARQQIAPLSKQMEEHGLDKGLLKQLFELGLMGIEIPEEFGGQAGDFFQSILAIEELSAIDPGVSVVVDVQNTLVINALLRWGSDAQKQKYLSMLATKSVGSYCLSEAGSGSDAFALITSAKDAGDHYVLNGQKLWITNANESDIFLVFATLDPAQGYKGITAFIVERGFPGFRVGKKEDKLGIRASSTCEILMDDCKVPKENVLGQVGKGYKVAIETLNEGRIGIAAQMVGLAQGALDLAVKHAKERKQFGRAIGEFQGIQFQLASMAVKIEGARLMVYNSARLRQAGLPFLQEAAMAKYYASQIAEEVASLAIEIHGGVGFTRDYPVEKYYRDAKIGRIYEGTSNMQLVTIAKKLLD